ncbi:peptidylprolyl isomerase [Roseospirillum parvum]|uniref:Parvulin-like PPIase n=1 Tax=Roseospirillum parvum TaxID=83401 RepID=A0A1G8ERX6_9PROT|nr:peptidylprolyl isomerase [Roseospirillum parvum]SDH72615.1 peptidyl-prolyl cis-trans isomerase SurA [Roseospirillum parvum]
MADVSRARRLAPALVAVFALLVGLDAPPRAAWAQQMQRIAAVVNDDLVSLYDVQARTSFVISTSNLANTEEVRQRLFGQILRTLIDERLRLKAAEGAGIEASEAEVDRMVASIEASNNLPPGSFERMLAANGLDRENARAQFRARIAWRKYIQAEGRRDLSVSDEEIEAELNQLKAAEGRPQRHLAEIVLTLDDPRESAELAETARQLVSQIRQGADFAALANRFSQTATAAVGGDLGWVPQGRLDPALERAIQDLGPGEVSAPVRTETAYHILKLIERRDAGGRPEESVFNLSQIHLPYSGAHAVSEARAAEIVEQARAAADCQAFQALAEEVATPGSGPLGRLKSGDLPDTVAQAVSGLEPGQTTPPVAVNDARLILMVCDRETVGGLPSRAEIEERLHAEKLNALSRRRLRELRRAAMIDIRL